MSGRFNPHSVGAGKRTLLAFIALIIVLLVTRFGMIKVGDRISEGVRRQAEDSADKKREEANSKADSLEPLIGQAILEGYGDPKAQPSEDLIRLAHALNNFALLVKGDNPLPLGSNEELAAALRGRNRAHLEFLPADHPVFNEQVQLVDRWQTPLFFHAEARDRLDIRSAGPDKIMWTEDDLHRKHDGSFLRGKELNSPSLYDPKSPKR